MILEQDALQFSYASYLLLSVKEEFNPQLTPFEAFTQLGLRGFATRFIDRNPTDPITLGEFAYLAQHTLTIPRGLLSSLFPSPRNSLRDLRFLEIIEGRSYTRMNISGARAMRIVIRAMSERETRL